MCNITHRGGNMMTIANSVWLATAVLHRDNPQAADFSVGEIVEKATEERLVDGFKPGLPVHVSKHCVANKSPNPARYRMLFETTRGRRRLFRNGDAFDADRKQGKVRPEKQDLPPDYQPLVDWYESVYSKQTSPRESTPLGTNTELTLSQEDGSARLPTAT